MKLNTVVSQHKAEVEDYVGVNITMVNINECLDEGECEGSCTNLVTISHLPYTVDSNNTAVVGVMIETEPSCTCRALNYEEEDTCDGCFNGGLCEEDTTVFMNVEFETSGHLLTLLLTYRMIELMICLGSRL